MKSFLKFLSRNKLYTAIEAVGLAVSLAFVVIIGSYAWQQWAVTHESPDRKNIYTFGLPNYPGLTFGFSEKLAASIPEVEMAVRYCPGISTFFVFGEKSEPARLIAVDPEFFNCFPYYRFLEGGPAGLATPDDVLVSASFARAHDLSIGSRLHKKGSEYTVAGIVEDFERTLFPAFDVIVHLRSTFNRNAWEVPFDRYGSTVTFAKVYPGTDRKSLTAKVEALCKEVYSDTYGQFFFEHVDVGRLDELFFKKYEWNQHAFRHGDRGTLRLLLVVGLLLLLSAIFNYVNLSFALTGRRAGEMATRRLLGEDRKGIILRQIVESVVFTAVCFGVGLLLADVFAPSVNHLLNNPDFLIFIRLQPGYVAAYALLVLVVGVAAGLFPALLAGRYNPLDVVRGNFRRHTKMAFSKVFIVLQNVLAVFFIALALIMEGQYHLSMHRPMNARTDGVFYLEISDSPQSQGSLQEKLATLPCVRRMGFSQRTPGLLPGGQFSTTLDGEEILYRTYRMDSTAFSIFGFHILKDYQTLLYGGVWFGERAFAATGLSDERLDISELQRRTSGIEQVAGVIADFPTNSSNVGEEEYLYVNLMRREQMFYGGWVIETVGDEKEAKKAIIQVADEWCNGRAADISYSGFIGDFFRDGLRPARNNMRLMEIFMLLAILIALLGLLAMSTYFADEKSRDIAVRKVFGSTVGAELWHNVREYMLLVAVACLFGIPLAVWATQKYLENYIYRLENYWWVFLSATAISLVMAFASVLWQTLKAAKTNPAVALKKE